MSENSLTLCFFRDPRMWLALIITREGITKIKNQCLPVGTPLQDVLWSELPLVFRIQVRKFIISLIV